MEAGNIYILSADTESDAGDLDRSEEESVYALSSESELESQEGDSTTTEAGNIYLLSDLSSDDSSEGRSAPVDTPLDEP
jgi:hypothetical protein